MTNKDPEPEETQPEENMLDRAVKATAAQKAENDRTEELLKRQERLQATALLGGKTEAGHIKPEPEPETDKDYAARILKGGLNVKN